MAGVRVELLVVLTGTLLLVSVRGWERVNETQLLHFYETGQLGQQEQFGEEEQFGEPGQFGEQEQFGEPQGVTSPDLPPDDGSDYYDGEDEFPDGDATSENFDSFGDHGFPVDTLDSGPRHWGSITSGGFQMEFIDTPPRNWASSAGSSFEMEFERAPPRSWTSGTSQSSTGLDVFCSEDGFQITLPTGPLSEVKVVGSKDLLPVLGAPESCGYEVNSFQNTLTVPFTGCHVKHEGRCKTDSYSLQLLYVNDFGQTQVGTASCEGSLKSEPDLFPRASGQLSPTSKKCPDTTPDSTIPSKAQNCAVVTGERVTCGQSGISSSDCEMMGCCVDSSTSACYYPLDECTGDQNFVFAIRFNSASGSVDPTKLVIPGNTNCKPVIVNDKVAIFKFKVTECGTRAYEVGETKIYLAEVQSIVQALNLKYGVITRSDPIRFMVECRYGKSGKTYKSLASIGYMVKTPSSSLPSSVISNGLYGVQLRIAKDSTYSSYLPTYHQPLRLLLGNPVYLELRLKSPKPDAVILVNYCVAYPRSAKNALVLIYEGCANPYDKSVSILQISGNPKNRYLRRFVVKAFQFMDQKTNKYLDEEIYFMCSSEVCRPAEKTCAERCFDGKAPPTP